MKNVNRYHSFDLLRGFFIILALIEHFTFFTNNFFLTYYKPMWFGTFQYSFIYSSTPLPTDTPTVLLMTYFGAWVSQVYIALACFNLGISKDKSKEKMLRNNKLYFLLFCLFSFEKLIISNNIGELLSIHPLQTWMVILLLINTSKYLLGTTKTLMIGSIIGLTSFIPMLNTPFINIQIYLQNAIHPQIWMEARPQIFLIASCIGLFLGEIFQSKNIPSKKYLLACSTSLFIACLTGFLSPDYTVIPDNLLHNEYDWSYNLLSAVCIWSTIAGCIFGACYIERKNWAIELPIINTIGVNSLWYFFFHRIFFIFLFVPTRIIWANITGYEIQNTLLNTVSAITIYTIIFFSLGKVKRIKK